MSLLLSSCRLANLCQALAAAAGPSLQAVSVVPGRCKGSHWQVSAAEYILFCNHVRYRRGLQLSRAIHVAQLQTVRKFLLLHAACMRWKLPAFIIYQSYGDEVSAPALGACTQHILTPLASPGNDMAAAAAAAGSNSLLPRSSCAASCKCCSSCSSCSACG
jgi:hypothetical protein